MRRLAVAIFIISTVVLLGGCQNSKNAADDVETNSMEQSQQSDESTDYDYNSTEEDVEDDMWETDEYWGSEMDQLHQCLVDSIQNYSTSDLYERTIEKNIAELKYAESEETVEESMQTLKKIFPDLYGDNITVNYEKETEEEFSIPRLQQAVDDEEDVDIVESLDKTVKYVVKTGCDLQRCVKSDIAVTIQGDKDTYEQTISTYLYQIDDVWYMDLASFDDIFYRQKGLWEKENDPQEDEEYDFSDSKEDFDYSFLLLN